MFKLFLKRFIVSIPTLIIVSILVFLAIRILPGDPVDILLGERGAHPEIRKEFEERLGLDQPIYVQYFLFVKRAITGDLGTSILEGRPVLQEFFSRFPATLELSISALLLAIILGIPLGILSGLFRNSLLDRIVVSLSLVGYSMSIFWWGLILILFFSISLEWTPISGRINVFHDVEFWSGFMLIDTLRSPEPWEAFKSFLNHLILPTLTLATIPLTAIVRMTRSSLIETLQEDFIRTARAKGLSFYTVVVKHAFRNALLPIVTVIGWMFGTLITGAVLTETVFSWPGIGRWMVQAVLGRDYPVLQGGILLLAVIVLVINFCVDIIYIKIDPRVRKGIS